MLTLESTKKHAGRPEANEDAPDNSRILYHVTTDEAYAGIQRDMLIKPNEKGKIWLCQSCKLDWTIQHLWRQGKLVKIILGVDTHTAIPWLPIKGVWIMSHETPSWFFVARIPSLPNSPPRFRGIGL